MVIRSFHYKRDKETSRVQTEHLVELPGQAQLGVGTHKGITDTKGQQSLAESESGTSLLPAHLSKQGGQSTAW